MGFWEGFEKRAIEEQTETKEPKKPSLLKHTLGAGAALLGANTASLGAGILGSKVDHKMSKAEVNRYINHMKERYGTRIYRNYHVANDLSSAYDMNNRIIYHAPKPALGSLAHEMGHATKIKPHGLAQKIIKQYFKGHGAGAVSAGLFTPMVMASSDNEKVQKLAPYAGVAALSPLLYEEGIASLNAIKNISHLHGTKAALRSIPGLLGYFGTYLSLGAAPGLIAKKYIDKKREFQAQQAQKLDASKKRAPQDGFEPPT